MAPTISYTKVAGAPTNPQAMGQFKVAILDVKFLSGDANDAGDFVVDPDVVGMTKILGVIDLNTKTGGAAADIARSVDFAPATNTVTFYATDRGALDIDAADFSQARLAFIGY